MRTLSASLLLSLLVHTYSGQSTQIFYLDHSVQGDDGMNQAALTDLTTRLNTAAQSGYVLLYVSDGTNPVIARKAADIDAAVDQIYSRNTRAPQMTQDKKQLRDLLFDDVGKMNGPVIFYFYLSDREAKAVADGRVSLVSELPRELASASGKHGAIEVNICYANNSKRVQKSQIEQTLSFYNQKIQPQLTYKIFDL